MLAHQRQLRTMMSAFRLGANAYLAKAATCDTFIKTLELVMLGETFLPPEILSFICHQQDRSRAASHSGRAVHPLNAPDDKDGDAGEMIGTKGETNELVPRDMASLTPLSTPQQSILRCLIQGDSNKSIARKLAISEATAKVHVKSILRENSGPQSHAGRYLGDKCSSAHVGKRRHSTRAGYGSRCRASPETRLFRPAGELRSRGFPARQVHRPRLREQASLLLKGMAGRKLRFQKAAAAGETSNRGCRVGFQPIPRLGAYTSVSGPKAPGRIFRKVLRRVS